RRGPPSRGDRGRRGIPPPVPTLARPELESFRAVVLAGPAMPTQPARRRGCRGGGQGAFGARVEAKPLGADVLLGWPGRAPTPTAEAAWVDPPACPTRRRRNPRLSTPLAKGDRPWMPSLRPLHGVGPREFPAMAPDLRSWMPPGPRHDPCRFE